MDNIHGGDTEVALRANGVHQLVNQYENQRDRVVAVVRQHNNAAGLLERLVRIGSAYVEHPKIGRISSAVNDYDGLAQGFFSMGADLSMRVGELCAITGSGDGYGYG